MTKITLVADHNHHWVNSASFKVPNALVGFGKYLFESTMSPTSIEKVEKVIQDCFMTRLSRVANLTMRAPVIH